MRFSIKTLLIFIFVSALGAGWYAFQLRKDQLNWQQFSAARFDAALDDGRDVLVCIGFKPARPWMREPTKINRWRSNREIGKSYQIDTPEFCKFVNQRRVAMFYINRDAIDDADAKKLAISDSAPPLHPYIAVFLPTLREDPIILSRLSHQSELVKMLSL